MKKMFSTQKRFLAASFALLLFSFTQSDSFFERIFSSFKHNINQEVSASQIALQQKNQSNAMVFNPGTTCIGLAADAIGGNVWEDLNFDGATSTEALIIGVSGIEVNLFNAANQNVHSAITDANGDYLFSGLTEATYRLEFVIPTAMSAYTKATLAGQNSGTTVQFVAPGTCANLGVANPNQFCESTPQLVTPCYVSGEPSLGGTAANGEVLVTYPYAAGGMKSDVRVLAVNQDMGSTWGLAYSQNTQNVYAAAMLKRHTGFGPLDIDGIYKVDYSDPNNPVIDNWLKLSSIGVDVGTNPRTANNYTLPEDADSASVDPAAFDAVGKLGLGDLDISEDEKTLYAINLNNNGSIVMIDIENKSLINEVAIPNPGCGQDGEARPWGLGIHKGDIYVGLICNGEASGVGDLQFFILKYDGNSFSTVVNESLGFDRGYTHTTYNLPDAPIVCRNWETWTDDDANYHSLGITTTGKRWCRPQPILSDIEFDRDGSIIAAFMDRTGHQTGYAQANLLNDTIGHGYISGDILRIYNNNGTYELENNGTTNGGGGCGPSIPTLIEGPGGGEFYCGENYKNKHQETTMGGIALFPNDDLVALNVMDPTRVFSGGTMWLSNNTGMSERVFELYASYSPIPGNANTGTFGKAAGLGDLELICSPPPLEIGNYVWNDKNGNGIQDAGEMGMDGITVELVKNGVLVATTMTQDGGQYYFSMDGVANQTWTTTGDKLLPNMEYCIRISMSETSLDGFGPSQANADNSTNGDSRDNDAVEDNGYAKITMTTGDPGSVDHTNDFGFASGLCLGDYVWIDKNEDGIQDSNETGISGIVVELIKNNQVVASSITDNNGIYGFTKDGDPNQTWVTTGDELMPNMAYTIRIDMRQQQLAKFTLTAANQTDDERDSNGTINGDYAQVDVTSGNVGSIQHQFDFGFIPSLCVGNLVWLDANNNGLADAGEAGLAGIEVILFDIGIDQTKGTADDIEIARQTTDNNGKYLFENLKEGKYYIKLNSGIPTSHGSSTGSGADGSGQSNYEPGQAVSTDINNDDNGTLMGTMIMSDSFSLVYCMEPINDGDDDDNTNLSVDFGVIPCLSLGNLIWKDNNNNGLVDAGEKGVPGVEVILYKTGPDGIKATSDDVEIQKTTSDQNGNYLFTHLQEGDYYVKLASGLPDGYGSSTGELLMDVDGVGPYETAPDPDNDINNDDNGNQMNYMIMSDLITLNYHQEPINDDDNNDLSNLTVDFGIFRLLRLGNLVWEDYNNNGHVDTGEPGIPNVEVILFQVGPDGQKGTADDVEIDRDMTNADGYYIFIELAPGEYYVKLSSGIDHLRSSTGEGVHKIEGTGSYETAPDPDTDIDNEDNGNQMGKMVMSDLIMLEFMQEPIIEDNFVNSNFTLDFGLIEPMCIGNLVWADRNNNGIRDANEGGIPNIEVILLDAGPDAQKGTADDIEVNSQITSVDGYYSFCELNPGNYYIKLNNIASNYISSNGLGLNNINVSGPTEPGVTTNTDINNDDNGTQMGSMIMSDIATLVLYDEPTNDEDTSPSTNLTVDFGVLKKHEIRIHNPCTCLGNASSPTANDGQFAEQVTILSAVSGETWSVMDQTDAYDVNNNPIAIGAIAREVGIEAGRFKYVLDVRHYDGKGYSIKFSNGTDNLSTNNLCEYKKSCSFTTDPECTDCTPDPKLDTCKMTFIMGTDGEHRIDSLNCCDDKSTFADDGSVDGLYMDDPARDDKFTICPQNQWQSLNFIFDEFDLAAGDTLYVYDGRSVTDSLLGKYSNNGVSQTGGWVAASCSPSKNPSGCLTFRFVTNGDNNKAKGWHGHFECKDRNIKLTPPNITPAVLACKEVAQTFTIEPATIKADCGTVQDSQIVRIYDANGNICKDTCLAHNENFQEAFAIGIYRVEYKLKSDTVKTAETFISVQAPSLICNDKIRTPLGAGCNLLLTPDDILETPCDTVTDTLYYYISIIGKDKNGKDEVISSGGGKGGQYPMITKAQFDKYGGNLRVEIERRFYEGLTLNICNNGPHFAKCSTTLELDDNSGPVFPTLTQDTFKVCDVVLTEEGLGLTKPAVVDNCNEATVTFERADITKGGGPCDTTLVDVTWKAVDANGNETTQVQKVVLFRSSLDDLVKPINGTLTCGEDTDAAFHDSTKVAYPGLKIGRVKNGVLQATDTLILSTEKYICGYILQKKDIFIEADCGKKLFRYWDILDWCNAGAAPMRIDTQFINLKDQTAPKFDADELPFTNLELDHFSCTYDITTLANPTATDNCSAVSVRMDAVFRIEDDKNWAIEKAQWNSLDCDSFRVRWVAEDACHEQLVNDTLMQTVEIKDVTKPSAVCTDKLHISLPNEHGVRIHVKDIDAGSYDACSIESRLIRIKDSGDEWADYVEIGCHYIHDGLQIEMQVIDNKGNDNICWLDVLVEDKIAPVCYDLPDGMGYCDEFHNGELGASTDTNENGEFDEEEWVELTEELRSKYEHYFGIFECKDNLKVSECGELETAEQYQLIEWPCGQVEIKRRHRAKDWSGNYSLNAHDSSKEYAYQNIKIAYRAGWKFTLPDDWAGKCKEEAIEPELIIENGTCDLLRYEVTEKRFEIPGDACYKLERTYHITNWCNYIAGQEPVKISREENHHGMATGKMVTFEDVPESGYYTYVQILKVHDEDAPVITITDPDPCINGIAGDAEPYGEEDQSPGIAPYECDEEKIWTATATDCSNQDAITWVGYLLDANGNIIEDSRTNTNTITYVVSNKETYTAEFWAYDGCGNSTGKKGATLEFWDCKKPTPYCIHGIATELMQTGMVDVWASDVNQRSYDNCTDQDRLKYRLWHESVGLKPSTLAEVEALPQVITFTCGYLGTQTIQLHVIDEEGNWDFCETYVVIQDNMGACDDLEPQNGMARINGTIKDWKGNNLANTDIQVYSMDNQTMLNSISTNNTGTYQFDLAKEKGYNIIPVNDKHHLNGISTFDMVLISKHILGIRPFENPYQYIAADVNQSKTITAFDLVQIRRLILNLETTFPNNTSWKFVEKDYAFTSDAPMAEDYPTLSSVRKLLHNMEMDFTAVKIGDVNGNAKANSLITAEPRKTGVLEISTPDIAMKAGMTYEVSFTTTQLENIQGYQFTLGFGELSFQKLSNGITNIENFGLHKLDKGYLTTSWNGAASDATSTTLFKIHFTATKDAKLSEQLSLIGRPTPQEAYTNGDELLDIYLSFTNPMDENKAFEVFQNEPNPFKATTSIGFYLPEMSEVTLTLRDEMGRLLQVIKTNKAAGLQDIQLDKIDLPKGLIYYQLSTKFGTQTKKMLRIE